jgi:pimeloyl-ACP methyl ester carboxylesterase
MDKAVVDATNLEYEVSGTGESVVFIHGAFIADMFRPLIAERSLATRHQLITYHRRGYMGSSHSPDPVSVAQQAADCRALLRHIGVQRAHVVGHSSGGCIALQLALDFPEVVHTLALLEPALMVGMSAQAYRESLVLAGQRYREADVAVVVDEFLKARWPGYHSALEHMLPGGFAQAIDNAPATFDSELPGLLDWTFTKAEARRITCPALIVLGGKSAALSPRFEETYRFLLDRLPHADGFVLPSTTHFLFLETPMAARGMAEALANFWQRHPVTISGRRSG